MNAADRIADALLRLAARRWPAEVRDELAREWAAAVHALRTDPEAGAARRATRQLRFAFSLALRRRSTTSMGWRMAGGRVCRRLAGRSGRSWC